MPNRHLYNPIRLYMHSKKRPMWYLQQNNPQPIQGELGVRDCQPSTQTNIPQGFLAPTFPSTPGKRDKHSEKQRKTLQCLSDVFPKKQHFPTENMDTKIPKKLGVGKLWFQSFSAFCNSTCALCCFWITCQAGIGRDRYSENCGAGEAGRGRGTGALGLGHTVDGRNPAPVDIVFRYQLDRYMTCVYVCSCIFVFTNIYIYIQMYDLEICDMIWLDFRM